MLLPNAKIRPYAVRKLRMKQYSRGRGHPIKVVCTVRTDTWPILKTKYIIAMHIHRNTVHTTTRDTSMSTPQSRPPPS